jgi:hypothetical protein
MTDTPDDLLTGEPKEPETSVSENADQAQSAKAKEDAEKEPQLKMTVYGPCKNPEGRYVGLSKKQRDALGVVEGGTVEIILDKESLGVYTVGKGSTEIVKIPDLFTVNGIEGGHLVTVRKPKETGENVMKFGVRHGVETVPEELKDEKAKEYTERTARRMKIIAERFPGVSTDEFMTVPTAVLNLITGDSAKIAGISRQKVRFAGKETEITVVPAGNDIGLTTKAAEELNIPTEIKELGIRVENGVLVID